MSTLNSRMRGLAATLALVAFVLGVPAVLVAIDAVPDLTQFAWSRLTAPDDGTLVVELIAAVCWIAWAVFTCQVVASIVSQIRGIRTPRLPGLAVPQLAADRLVAAAALLFVALPTATAFLPQPRAEAAATAAPLLDDTGLIVEPASAAAPSPKVEHEKEKAPDVERYTVKRGDSLWKIAEERLGDGTRYVELVSLNEAVLDGRPDFLLPGTILRVPIAKIAPADAYVVRSGDTLSEIAEDELGDADAYPTIYEVSRDTVQPNGDRLTDPDLILPGWKLTIPGQTPPDSREPKHAKPPEEVPDTTPSPTEVTPTEPVGEAEADSDESGQSPDDSVVPNWLVPGLAGVGAVLGGTLWIALRSQRQTQLRHRRPGTVIPPPPAELVPVEKTARATASVIASRVDALDAALRSVPALPLVTVTLSADGIALTLVEPCDLPAPWSGAGTEWRIGLIDVPDHLEDSFPPYPLLVSVGQRDDGSFLFLNLEELRTVIITGDSHRKASFARHVAAELAVNPWSVVTTVEVLGLGSDLSSFNLGRVRTHPAGDTGFIGELARDLSSITEPVDPDDFHAVIIASADRRTSDLDALAEVIEGIPGRSAAVLLDLQGDPRPSGTQLELTDDGRLRASSLGVDVRAAELSADEARACALLLDLTLDEQVVPVPYPDGDTAVSNLAGALSERLTEPRPEVGAAGAESLLPLDAVVYADAAATTIEDVEVLAPRASPEARSAVEAADPTLDEDLARWESPALSAAKLTLLGPVGARTTGDTKATAHRRPFYVELLAYLALHPRGVSGHEVAEAFGIRPERVRVDMSQLRRWLGNDPRTRKPYLPKAQPGSDPESPALYQLDGVLCDLDLFQRLRARGQSRGARGIGDLIAALRLVSGEPFTDLRKDHWSWLLDGDRWDHIMTSAIVDVGHVVTTHALAAGDRDLALWAAQVAYTAAPYDEVAQLDMVQAEKAAGDHDNADQVLKEKIFNRRDDELPPIDLPQRTAQIVDDKRWATRGPRPRRTG